MALKEFKGRYFNPDHIIMVETHSAYNGKKILVHLTDEITRDYKYTTDEEEDFTSDLRAIIALAGGQVMQPGS